MMTTAQHPRPVTLADLKIGERFIFDWEIYGSPYAKRRRGPWIKTGERTYRHAEDAALHCEYWPSAHVVRVDDTNRR